MKKSVVALAREAAARATPPTNRGSHMSDLLHFRVTFGTLS